MSIIWDPRFIDTDLWLDASDPSTLIIETGVSEWRDKSGKGNHVTQATAASQPAVQGNGVKFDGTDDKLGRSPSPFTVKPLTTFTVVTPVSPGKGAIYKTADSGGVALGAGNGSVIETAGTNFMGLKEGTKWISGGPFSIPDLWQAIWTASGSGSSLLRTGTVVVTESTAYDVTSGNFHFGGYLAPANRMFNGTIHENIFIKSILSDPDRQKIEGYLAWKWGLEASLPSGHPYELAAPFIASDFVTELNKGYAVDTSLAQKVTQMPPSPKKGNKMGFADYAGTFGTNNLIIYQNDKPIAGGVELTLNQNGQSVELTFYDDTTGWAITG